MIPVIRRHELWTDSVAKVLNWEHLERTEVRGGISHWSLLTAHGYTLDIWSVRADVAYKAGSRLIIMEHERLNGTEPRITHYDVVTLPPERFEKMYQYVTAEASGTSRTVNEVQKLRQDFSRPMWATHWRKQYGRNMLPLP